MQLGEGTWPTKHDYADEVLAAVLPAGEEIDSAEQINLEPLPRLVAMTRRFVASQVPDLEPETQDTLVLLTSELVTNAVIHARTPLRVGVIVSNSYVVVTVHDLDLGHSEIDPDQREGGRGLGLVGDLADAWAISKDGQGGKTVWFRLNRNRNSEPGDADKGRHEGMT